MRETHEAGMTAGWISVKERLPDTLHKCEGWDDDAKVMREYANSKVHPILRRNRHGYWCLDSGVYTSGWCAGWHQGDHDGGGTLFTIEPEYWLDYPPFPEPHRAAKRKKKAASRLED